MKRISISFDSFSFSISFNSAILWPDGVAGRPLPDPMQHFAMVRQTRTFAYHHRDPRILFLQYKLQSHDKGLTLTLCDLTLFALLEQISDIFWGRGNLLSFCVFEKYFNQASSPGSKPSAFYVVWVGGGSQTVS
jgi:hypothetical protein